MPTRMALRLCEDQLGFVRNAAGDVEAAQQAARQLPWAEAREFLESHELDGLFDQRPPLRAVAYVERAEVIDVLSHGELIEDGHLLWHDADAALEVVAGGRHRLAEQPDAASVVGE